MLGPKHPLQDSSCSPFSLCWEKGVGGVEDDTGAPARDGNEYPTPPALAERRLQSPCPDDGIPVPLPSFPLPRSVIPVKTGIQRRSGPPPCGFPIGSGMTAAVANRGGDGSKGKNGKRLSLPPLPLQSTGFHDSKRIPGSYSHPGNPSPGLQVCRVNQGSRRGVSGLPLKPTRKVSPLSRVLPGIGRGEI